jgi:hypothetical protein
MMTRFIIVLYHPNGQSVRMREFETFNTNPTDAYDIRTREMSEALASDLGYSLIELAVNGYTNRTFVELVG